MNNNHIDLIDQILEAIQEEEILCNSSAPIDYSRDVG